MSCCGDLAFRDIFVECGLCYVICMERIARGQSNRTVNQHLCLGDVSNADTCLTQIRMLAAG